MSTIYVRDNENLILKQKTETSEQVKLHSNGIYNTSFLQIDHGKAEESEFSTLFFVSRKVFVSR